MTTPSTTRVPPERVLIGKAARLHHEYGLTHQEVADVLHLSRVKVTRLLAQARGLGIVQVRVLADDSPFAALEAELARRFALDEALVVPSRADEAEQRRALALATAGYLQRVLVDGMVVAISLSRTIALIPQHVVDPRPTRVTFVAMTGGLRRVSFAANPYESTERLAQLFGGVAEHLHAPAFAGSPEVAQALVDDPTIGGVLERAASADAALLGIGGISLHATLVDEGELLAEEIEELVTAGAVGDAAGRFFDAAGKPVVHPIDSRAVGLTIKQIRRIPLRIVAAGGHAKIGAIAAALRGRLPTVLVVDAAGAEGLLGRDAVPQT